MSLPPINISDAVQEQAYKDLARGAMRQFGEALTAIARKVLKPRLKSHKELRLDWELAERMSDNSSQAAVQMAEEALDHIPPGRRIFPAPQLAGLIFRGSEFEPPETPIWNMWRRLLARACDRERAGEAHPAFPGIISQLAVDEARILEAYRGGKHPVIRVSTGPLPNSPISGFRWEIAVDDLPITMISVYIEHLEQLGLIKESTIDRGTPLSLKHVNSYRLDNRSKFFPLTAFGNLFLDAVVESD